MNPLKSIFAVLSVAAMSACEPPNSGLPPLGQIRLFVATDAPLPPPPGTPLRDDEATPLFDTVRVDVFAPGMDTPCSGCVRDLPLDRTLVANGASLGIVPTSPGENGWVARLRLFLSTLSVDPGAPFPDQSITVWVALPATSREGIVDITVPLRIEDATHEQGTREAPTSPIQGQLAAPLPMWKPAERAGCTSEPQSNEACVPGGALWLSAGASQATNYALNGLPQLVSVSPFFIDTTEITVRAFRESGLPLPPLAKGDADQFPIEDERCTFKAEASESDDLPINCISWRRARAYCLKRGADLPTEAQLAHVLGGLRMQRFPWGRDEPTCDDAVFGRDLVRITPQCFQYPHRPERAGTGARDKIRLGGKAVVDLVGNLEEMARDLWNLPNEACTKPGVHVDPLCETASRIQPGRRVVRGGDWTSSNALDLLAFRRFNIREKEPSPLTGFRCARPGR